MVRIQLLVMGILVACTASAADKLRAELSSFAAIEVAPFRNKVGASLKEPIVADLQERLVKSINESKLLAATRNTTLKFPKKDSDDDTKVVFEGTGKEEDKAVLVLFSEVITFSKGSRAKRYLLGDGTGREELRGNCYIVDKRTGAQLINFQTFGETNWGIAGGGADKTLKGYTNRIVSVLKGRY